MESFSEHFEAIEIKLCIWDTPDYRNIGAVFERRNLVIGHWQNGNDENGLKIRESVCLAAILSTTKTHTV